MSIVSETVVESDEDENTIDVLTEAIALILTHEPQAFFKAIWMKHEKIDFIWF